jgi:phenylpyruvate tautomerase PptA (4-oxalocrotonate tautomerase family)
MNLARRVESNAHLKKSCAQCGEVFQKPVKISTKQWEARLYCSIACNAIERTGKQVSSEVKERLSRAHKGMKKPWAGKYQRTERNREAAKLVAARYTKEQKAEIAKKISRANTGKKRSPETRMNIRIAQMALPRYMGGYETRLARRAFYERRRNVRKALCEGRHTLAEWEQVKNRFNHECPGC